MKDTFTVFYGDAKFPFVEPLFVADRPGCLTSLRIHAKAWDNLIDAVRAGSDRLEEVRLFRPGCVCWFLANAGKVNEILVAQIR